MSQIHCQLRFGVFVAIGLLFASIAVDRTAAQVQGFGSGPAATSPPAAGANSENGRDGDGEGGRSRGRREGRRNGVPRNDGDNDGGDRLGRAVADSASQPAGAPGAPAASSGFGGAGGDNSADKAAGIRKWATDLIKKHDKNGNMMLDADEQSDLASSSRSSDLNGDGVITLDELVIHISPKENAAPGPTGFGTQTSSANSSAGANSEHDEASRGSSSEAAKSQKGTGKSYRFRSTKDRQPSWRFAGKDANGDGQVSMSEYSRSWSDRTATEFRRYDRDNDGVITAEEVR